MHRWAWCLARAARRAPGEDCGRPWVDRGTGVGAGRRLPPTLPGWIDFGGNVGNVAWGEDGSTLFIAANATIYRVRLATRGAGWGGPPIHSASH
jgi:hypothetical protein